MQTRGSTKKSSIKLSAGEIKLTWRFAYEWGKPTRQKSHRVILSHHSRKSIIIKTSGYK